VDILFLAVIGAFLALTLALVAGCAALERINLALDRAQSV
jgi:hypothetical protein